jgi:hypothetical protein
MSPSRLCEAFLILGSGYLPLIIYLGMTSIPICAGREKLTTFQDILAVNLDRHSSGTNRPLPFSSCRTPLTYTLQALLPSRIDESRHFGDDGNLLTIRCVIIKAACMNLEAYEVLSDGNKDFSLDCAREQPDFYVKAFCTIALHCASPLDRMGDSDSLLKLRYLIKLVINGWPESDLIACAVVSMFSLGKISMTSTSLSAFSITKRKTCPFYEPMNNNHARLSPALVETIAGLTAGVATTLAAHPLDVIKTRLQSRCHSNFPVSLNILTPLSSPRYFKYPC